MCREENEEKGEKVRSAIITTYVKTVLGLIGHVNDPIVGSTSHLG